MKSLSFGPLNAAKLTVNGVYSLCKSTIDLAKPVIAQIGVLPAAGLTHLETLNLQLGASVNKANKSAYTQELQQMDKERDNILAEIKREISTGVKSSNTDKKLAASALQLFMSPYWESNVLPQDVETGVVDDCLVKLNASEELKTAAVTLDITGLFASLDTKNKAFDQKFKNRNTEYAEKGEPATAIKPLVVPAYVQFCTALEQTVNLAPNDTVLALFYQLDELRKKYHALEGKPDAKTSTDAPPAQ